MDKPELEQRQAAVKARFDEAQNQRQALYEEMMALKGEHRLIDELIASYPEEGDNSGTEPGRTGEPTQES